MAHRHAPRGPVKATPHPLDIRDPLDSTCTARSKRSGVRCKRYAIPGGRVCVMHGGKAPQVIEAAQARLLRLQHPALDALEYLVHQREFPSAAYAAARDILDRTEGKPHESVSLEHSGGLTITWQEGE
jgi:hypothetical protein